MIDAAPEFHYRADRPAGGLFPGAHRSERGGAGFEPLGVLPLPQARDARRLDLRASLRDPFEQWQVRVHAQRAALSVWLLADLSASMGFVGQHRRLDALADLLLSVARSAHRHGDRFGFAGADHVLRPEWLQPASRRRGGEIELAAALRAHTPPADDGRDCAGLLDAARRLGRRRALVFLASDFHLPETFIHALLRSLTAHQLVPVVLWDAAEFELPAPRAGRLGQVLWPLADPETGQTRLVWARRATRERWQGLAARRRALLRALFARHRLRPVFMERGFDADALSAHFVGG